VTKHELPTPKRKKRPFYKINYEKVKYHKKKGEDVDEDEVSKSKGKRRESEEEGTEDFDEEGSL